MTWQPGTACEYQHVFTFLRLSALQCLNFRIDMMANGVVKVADFGLAEDMYGTNYYCNRSSEGGERVPIRWMAPESIDTNIYNEATDVVSTCRQQGYK